MPTGYTADIYEGRDVSFSDFALKCARAFGACIEQRDDDPNDKPKLINKNNKDNYHVKALVEAKKWKKPTKTEFDAYVKERIAYYSEKIDWSNKLKIRYQNMLDEVNAWTPPTSEHAGLKSFMIEQLSSSIRYDCSNDYYESELSIIKSYTYDQYVKDMRDSNNRNIEYHTNELKKENERIDSRNEWISALYKSLKN